MDNITKELQGTLLANGYTHNEIEDKHIEYAGFKDKKTQHSFFYTNNEINIRLHEKDGFFDGISKEENEKVEVLNSVKNSDDLKAIL